MSDKALEVFKVVIAQDSSPATQAMSMMHNVASSIPEMKHSVEGSLRELQAVKDVHQREQIPFI